MGSKSKNDNPHTGDGASPGFVISLFLLLSIYFLFVLLYPKNCFFFFCEEIKLNKIGIFWVLARFRFLSFLFFFKLNKLGLLFVSKCGLCFLQFFILFLCFSKRRKIFIGGLAKDTNYGESFSFFAYLFIL